MALNLSPWQFQYGRSPAAQNIQTPTWGPPDMSKQLQEGIANILPQLAKSYQAVNNQFQNEAAGKEWMKGVNATQQQQPAEPGFEARRLDQGEGPRAPLSANLQTIADAKDEQYGLPKGYMSQLVSTESSGDPNAISPTGARGATQFTAGTWKTYGLGKNPMDPEANIDAGARYAVANRAELTAGLGREPTAGELYLAHQQGAGGALALLKNPDRPAAEVTAPKNILVNGGDMGITAGEFAKKWTSRFDGIGGPAGPQQGPGNGVAPGAMAAAGGAPVRGPGTQTAQQQPQGGGTAPVTANAPQVVAAAAPGVVTRSPPPEKAVASGSNQPPLFQTPDMAAAAAGASGAQAPGVPPGQPIPPASAIPGSAPIVPQQMQPGPAVPPPPMPPQMVPDVTATGAVPQQPAMPPPPPAGPSPLPNQPGPAAGNPAAAPPAPQPAAAGPAPAVASSRMPAAGAVPPPPPQVLNRMGIAPEALQAANPSMLRALGHAIMANDPHMVAAITGGINAITASSTAKAASADYAVEHDSRGNWVRINKRTGEVEPLPGFAGGSQARQDEILLPGDPRRAQFTTPDDKRPWRLTQDANGNIKPEPISMPDERESKQPERIREYATAWEGNKQVQDYRQLENAVGGLRGALSQGNGVSDMVAVVQLFKSIDPNSTVSATETANAQTAGGVDNRLWGFFNQIQGGGSLTPKTRAQMFNVARQILEERRPGVTSFTRGWENRAKSAGLNPADVTGGYQPQTFDRAKPEEFVDRRPDGQPRSAGEAIPGEKKTPFPGGDFKSNADAAEALEQLGLENPGWYSYSINGKPQKPVFTGQRG